VGCGRIMPKAGARSARPLCRATISEAVLRSLAIRRQRGYFRVARIGRTERELFRCPLWR
jgi:hypothetical protein